MDDEAHVAFVYAHAEGDCGDYHAHAVQHECFLGARTLFGVHARVVMSGLYARPPQHGSKLLAGLAAPGVDDAWAFARLTDFQQPPQLLLFVRHFLDLIIEVGPKHTGDDRLQVTPQLRGYL